MLMEGGWETEGLKKRIMVRGRKTLLLSVAGRRSEVAEWVTG